MERLNIYPYKKRKVKLTTFVVLLAVMLLPPVSFNVYFRYVKEQMVENLENRYAEILNAYSVNLSIDSSKNLEEVSRIEDVLLNQIRTLESKVNSLNSYLEKRKKWEDFSDLFTEIFKKQGRTLSYLSFSPESVILEFYEVSRETQEVLPESFLKDGRINLKLLFEEHLPEGYTMKKYRLEYGVAKK
ncbi:hypothetical protein [Thermotoga neapolitana]|uniref:Uncharacterized protein n=1 Tax=Thermotoga neapolitana (strain ATCC 49049 / DSM 4359 / NBRC 107923 / NS-E) TaxID=309803 RepID=B9K744_THENN|nr:hypothetical protein [Thermotoga neapolitana]ACM22777.1 Putative uncharacterized protein [Thermotoga neapolitana DSM 4359]KFZ22397.1 hypothetical protein LA10_03022 [Thermotoga neapolitana LA10]HBF11700.1 hypothetical protein [Thermotoga neapolitana]